MLYRFFCCCCNNRKIYTHSNSIQSSSLNLLYFFVIVKIIALIFGHFTVFMFLHVSLTLHIFRFFYWWLYFIWCFPFFTLKICTMDLFCFVFVLSAVSMLLKMSKTFILITQFNTLISCSEIVNFFFLFFVIHFRWNQHLNYVWCSENGRKI